MKSIHLYFLLLYTLIIFRSTNLVAQTSDSWFSVKKLDSKTWIIDEQGAVNVYLLEGNDKALIIDTGLGIADLLSVIKSITDKPLMVVNTHAHSDHAGANFQFEKIFVHPNDIKGIKEFNSPPIMNEIISTLTNGNRPSEFELYKGKLCNSQIFQVNEGYVFDLGGRKIEVIETPGHTSGSICLLDIDEKVLYTGDTNNTIVWLFLDECLPLSEYLKTLKKQVSRINEFDTLMPGHGLPASCEFIKDQIECVKNILNGTCKNDTLKTFLGNRTLCKYGFAKVAYNPGNL